jgi:acyl-CoA synthetase (NDP forming)
MSQSNSQTPSRSPSFASEREEQPTRSRRQARKRRGQPRSSSVSSDEYDEPQRRSRTNVGGLPAFDQVEDTGRAVTKTAPGAVNKVGETAGQAVGDDDKEEGKDQAISLRLDLNLDVYVKLKAKIHGDLTLQLL